MTVPVLLARVAACLAVCLLLASPARAADPSAKLGKEKARLEEMKKKAEKTAAELAETLRREKMSRSRMGEYEARLAKQRKLIARIDRRLSLLGGQMERTEREVRALDEERGRVRWTLSSVTGELFAGERTMVRIPAEGASGLRRRYFARRVLGEELARYGRLTADKEDKEKVLSGIERRIEDSERRMAEQKKTGEKLATQQEEERRRLAEIEKKKKEKSRELRALKARIARMEALVSRIERRAGEREKEKREKGLRKAGPERFTGVPGGLFPPLAGKLTGKFGKQRDPVFDVVVENRGVEIEAPSGAVIHAVGKGEVVFTGGVSGFGRVLILQHGSGLFSVYGKAAGFSVKQGQAVAAREAVGQLPESPDGKSVLYLELRAAGTAIDPSTVLPLSR
jgi:septal ring factor EnvC (AmiA/AmiB activator)